LASLREGSQLFFSLIPAGEGRFSFDNRKEFLEENGEEYDALNQSLRRIGPNWSSSPEARTGIQRSRARRSNCRYS